ncbi:fibronectin type III domain-containing protein [Candidatus Parcubacteria bacterium]|nr:fibronectin type III domain-containing protein [Candidatus Parcubacteria bacterium]
METSTKNKLLTNRYEISIARYTMKEKIKYHFAVAFLAVVLAASFGFMESASAQTNLSKPVIAFAPHPNYVVIGQPATLVWETKNAVSCAASMSSGGSIWSGSKAVSGSESFTMSGLGSGVGYILTCTSPDGGQASQRVVIYGSPAGSTPVPSPILPTVDITAYPSSVTGGQNTTLYWATVDASSCVASGDWSGARAASGSMSVAPLSTLNTYTLTCANALGSVSKTVTVTATSAESPVISLTASRGTVTLGLSTALSWSVTNTTSGASCTASGAADWSGAVGLSGTKTVVPATQPAALYTLTCTNPGSLSARSDLTITVWPADTTPPIIYAFGLVTPTATSAPISWYTDEPSDAQVEYGTTVSYGSLTPLDPRLDQNHEVNLTGLSPGTLYYYRVRSRDESGNLGLRDLTFTTLSLTPPTLTFTPNLPPAGVYEVSPGQVLTFNWLSANVTSCTASNQLSLADWSGSKPLAGSQTVTASQTRAANYSYSLACSGPNGSVTKRVTVYTSLSSPPPPAPVPTVSLSASPSSITSGQSSTLTWSSTNATSCSAPWTSSTATSGSQSVSPTSNTTYTLSCTGSGGSVSKSATVTVTPGPLTGIVFRPDLEGRTDFTGITFTIKIYTPGNSTPLATFSGTGGNISLPPAVALNPGSFDLTIEAPYYLRKRLSNTSLSSGLSLNFPKLPAGDLNQDGVINSLDWSVMSPNWFTNSQTSDINRDGVVNSIDFSLLNRNWGRGGE